MRRLKYKKVLIKLSGEALGKAGQGIEITKLSQVVRELKTPRALGVQVVLVIGAGNIWRKREQGKGMDEVTADYLGIMATMMNAYVLARVLNQAGIKTVLQSYLMWGNLGFDKINNKSAKQELTRGKIIIYGGGTGKPFVTTDTLAARQAVALGVDLIIKAGPVDGVYSADPRKIKSARKYQTIAIKQALRQNLKVMDKQAFAICRRYKIPIIVGKWQSGIVKRAVLGKKVGTLIN